MAKHTKVIHGFTVEVETEIDDDPPTQGWVEKGNYSASIARATQEGAIYNSNDMPLHIKGHTLNMIENWADSVGY